MRPVAVKAELARPGSRPHRALKVGLHRQHFRGDGEHLAGALDEDCKTRLRKAAGTGQYPGIEERHDLATDVDHAQQAFRGQRDAGHDRRGASPGAPFPSTARSRPS